MYYNTQLNVAVIGLLGMSAFVTAHVTVLD